MSIQDFIANLSKEDMEFLQQEFNKRNNAKPTYSFSKITENILENLVDIEIQPRKTKFNNWFDNNIYLDDNNILFLSKLLDKNIDFINEYSEEDLKVKFLAPLLNKIDFFDKENNFRDFYELPLRYETEKFIFNGTTDFVVSKGLFRAKKPYFFIQEFKKGKKDGYPESQLLAELITGIELNNWKEIKGCFIVGAIWNFVILEKLDKDKYQYFVSQNFDSTKIEDLKDIYRNLLFVKNEIIGIVKKENK